MTDFNMEVGHFVVLLINGKYPRGFIMEKTFLQDKLINNPYQDPMGRDVH